MNQTRHQRASQLADAYRLLIAATPIQTLPFVTLTRDEEPLLAAVVIDQGGAVIARALAGTPVELRARIKARLPVGRGEVRQ
ncbi:hypothetical protein QYE80_08220 [Pseudomonas tohonis]|nr:hypothetical protein L682_27190 [Pseudomonas alcaligenes OT 69]MDN4144960.1 hypothetical protein [Pseudomonas tohonis]